MSEFTDALVSAHLRADPALRLYHHDPTYHAEWQHLRTALERAHAALLAVGDEQADDIARALAAGLPDASAAAQRIDEHRQRTRQLMVGRR